jgi:hypothetical protein
MLKQSLIKYYTLLTDVLHGSPGCFKYSKPKGSLNQARYSFILTAYPEFSVNQSYKRV